MTRTFNPPVLGSDGLLCGPGGTPANPVIAQVLSPTASLVRLSIAQPSAGAEWSYTVPANTWIRVLSTYYTCAMSSTVGGRYPGCRIQDGSGNLLSQQVQAFIQTANLVPRFSMTRSAEIKANGTNDGIMLMFIQIGGFVLSPGWTFSTHMANLQSGDQYSSVELWVEQWSTQPIFEGLGPLQA